MLKEGVTEGVWFSEVMAQFPDVFSPASVALVRAGEKAHMLEDGMVRAASEILRETYEKIRTDPGLTVSDEGKGEFIEQLRIQLSDKSADVRLGALQALSQLAGADSIKDYVKALSDADSRIRCVTAQILAKYPSADAISPLVKALKDKSIEVKMAVLQTLAICDHAKGFEAAKAALSDPEVEIRRAAVRALALSNMPEVAALLKELASDYDTLVAKDAQDALANLPE
jgi:HEAT repeat protein